MTSDIMFEILIPLQPFQIWPEMKTKVQNLIKYQFLHRTIICQKNLKCTLRCSNGSSTNHQWHWIPIINPSWCKSMLYHHPSNLKNYSIGHKSETILQNNLCYQNLHIITPVCQFMTGKWKYKWQTVFIEVFLISEKSAINGPPKGPVVRYWKI